MSYIPLTCKTQGSLGLSQTTPKDIAAFCEKYKLKSAGLCDIANLSQCVNYYKAMTAVDKKPIFGIQLRVCDKFACVHEDNPTNKRVIIIAKNLNGWKQLLKISYESNNAAFFDDGGRLSVEELVSLINDNLIVIVSSDLSEDELKQLQLVSKNLWCGINPVEGLTKNPLNLDIVPITPNYYLNPNDKLINQTLICDKYNVQLENKEAHPALNNPDYVIQGAALYSKFGFSKEEISNTERIYDQIEEFSILNEPALPDFDCPDGLSQYDYLRRKCWDGFKRLGIDENETYINQIKHELEVIKSNGMSGYFLVVSDITDFCRKNGILLGYGRGSAGGSVISYATGIIETDPIKHNLLFERFYSADRGGLPDIDLDIQPSRRQDIVDYMCEKYGTDRFMQISTFGTMKGKASIRCALRVFNHSMELQNEIAKCLPEEHKISAQLEEQEKTLGTSSSIVYALLKGKLNRWCNLELKDENKMEFTGPMAKEIKLSVEINSIIKSRGRHASAFVLGKESLHHSIPVVFESNHNSYVLDPEMNACESMGGVKLDLLGLKLLDKYQYSREMLRGQKI